MEHDTLIWEYLNSSIHLVDIDKCDGDDPWWSMMVNIDKCDDDDPWWSMMVNIDDQLSTSNIFPQAPYLEQKFKKIYQGDAYK